MSPGRALETRGEADQGGAVKQSSAHSQVRAQRPGTRTWLGNSRVRGCNTEEAAEAGTASAQRLSSRHVALTGAGSGRFKGVPAAQPKVNTGCVVV